MEGSVNASQQDQQETRQHIGVVVGVVGRTDPERCSDHELAHQTAQLAEQRAVGHHQGDALEDLAMAEQQANSKMDCILNQLTPQTPGATMATISGPPRPLMSGLSLLQFEPLREGVLLKRYKRLSGRRAPRRRQWVTARANTGPMTGVLIPGQRVRLRHAPSPTRKLAWTWEQAEVPGADGSPCWVGINTALPNPIRATIKGCLQEQLGEIASGRSDLREKQKSRIDLLLQPSDNAKDPRPIYVESRTPPGPMAIWHCFLTP